MGKIKAMDAHLATLIAAGEVVENPASIVKELLENALDANASFIHIALEEAGLRKILIRDNGEGMDEDDLRLATQRHATSKLLSEHDLYHLASLGFRGEALASIAQVATVTIESSTSNAVGYKRTVSAGQSRPMESGEARQGTTITVQELFYHTPARLKHLKSVQAEFSFVLNVVQKLALAHPHTAFHLEHDGKRVFQTLGDADVKRVLYTLYGADVLKETFSFDIENTYYKVQAHCVKPTFSRSQKNHIHLIVNGRMITNQKLLMAVKKGYHDVLPSTRYPIAFVNITADPVLLDVNIHPQKLEVKFTEEAALLELIQSNIERQLRSAQLIHKDYLPRSSSEHIPQQFFLNEEPYDEVQRPTEPSDADPAQKPRFPELEYIGQAQGTYLIFQGFEGVYLIDQHAAEERVRYETYAEAMQKHDGLRQSLTVPLTVQLSRDERIRLDERLDWFEQCGLRVEPFEYHSLRITEVPRWMHPGYEEIYTEAMVQQLLDDQALSLAPLIDQMAKDIACKHSIKGNTSISRSEVDQLIVSLRKLKNPFQCPHGRPTIVLLSQDRLEKMFQRIAL